MRSAETTSTFRTAFLAKNPAATSRANRNPGQATFMSKQGQEAPMRFCTMPAKPGEMVSALMVAAMIRSSSSGFTPLFSRARTEASTPRSVTVSVVHTRRSFTPTRLTIHSSEVSTMWDRSSLVTTRWGTKLPVPKMQKLI